MDPYYTGLMRRPVTGMGMAIFSMRMELLFIL